jgi:hypothetical protein
MPKLAPSAANIRFVADELARDLGSREKVSLADVRTLIGGPAETVAVHFGGWLVGDRQAQSETPDGGPTGSKETLGDSEWLRRGGAIRDGTASRRPADTDAPVPGGAGAGAPRNASEKGLREVVRFALDGAEHELPKSFLKDVWEKEEEAARGRTVRTVRPSDAPKRLRNKPGKRRPDVPKEVRRKLAAERLEAVRAAGAEGLGPAEGPPARTIRRVRDSDWKGASNTLVARHAAAALRNAGHPLIPSEICADIAASGGPLVKRPGRDLVEQLEGSRMIRVGTRSQIWFEGETPPERPPRPGRRDTTEALNRELSRRLFAKALGILRAKGRSGISLKALRAELGPEIGDFNRDWLKQRFRRAAADPTSHVIKIPGGFAWVEGRKPAPPKRKG